MATFSPHTRLFDMAQLPKIDAVKPVESTLLVLEIPKTNDKQELAMSNFLRVWNLRDKQELKQSGGYKSTSV